LTIRQLADRWSVHRATVYRMIQRQELSAIQIGPGWRIPITVIEAYESAQLERAQLESAGAEPGEED
jgi:excisionase family DNA binding protein